MEDFTTISLNSSNLDDPTFNNKYSINFPSGLQVDKYTSIAVSQVSLYFSWFNISASIGNNRIDLIFPTSTTDTTISITITDGYYSVETLNQYLQSVMIANNMYMVDTNGNYVYYIEILTNPTYYGIQFVMSAVP